MSAQQDRYESKRAELNRQFKGQMLRTGMIALGIWLAITLVAILLRDVLGVFMTIVISFLSFVVIAVLTGQQIGAIKKRRDIQLELLGQDEPFKRFSVE